MKETFIDTSFLVAIVSEQDELRARAIRWSRALIGSSITTELILLELADGFASPHLRHLAQRAISRLKEDPFVEIIPASSELIAIGYDLYTRRPDKAWSLTDCVSFAVMAERSLTNALTHDHHFEQAGFRALLREEPPSN
jgi:uncharacterized protein